MKNQNQSLCVLINKHGTQQIRYTMYMYKCIRTSFFSVRNINNS